MRRVLLVPHNKFSNSAKLLTERLRNLGVSRLKRTISPKNNRLIVNWGCSDINSTQSVFINTPEAVRIAVNKLHTFTKLVEASLLVPEYTTEIAVAQGWVDGGAMVVERTLLSSHSGKGIVLRGEGSTVGISPLYVKYKKKRKEFRIHVCNEEVIDVQEKRKRRGFSSVDTFIRNHANGWVFCRDGVELPPGAADLSIAAVRALGLDFGAVDLIWNSLENRSYLLEVNTAPGLEGSTLDLYSNSLLELINERNRI